MATPYSSRFVGATLTGTGTAVTQYTVPASSVAVVRDIETTFGVAGAFIFFQIGTGPVWNFQSTPPANVSVQWQGRVVLLAGETLRVAIANTIACHVIVSGYLLAS